MVPYGVHYPAVGLENGMREWANAFGAALDVSFLGAYQDSVDAGTADVLREFARIRNSECFGYTKIFLAGFSQGAQAAANALQKMSADDRDQTAASVFFGDPYFNPNSWAARGNFSPDYYGALDTRPEFASDLRGSVFSYCHNNDPICNLSLRRHIWGTPWDVYIRNPKRLIDHWFAEHTNYVAKGDSKRAARDVLDLMGFKPEVSASDNTPLDLVFVIDTTGSMDSALVAIKQNMGDIVSRLVANTSDYRLALVDYKDVGDAYQSRTVVPFTANASELQTGVDSLEASGGGDTPESVYSGIMRALSMPWRDGVKKAVVVIGDAPPKDPEPVTGYTARDVIAKALSVDPAAIDTLSLGDDAETSTAFAHLSAGSAGVTVAPSDVSTLATSLKETVANAGESPIAILGGPYRTTRDRPVLLSAAGTTDPYGHVVSYEWDLDGDGEYETSTGDPTIEPTFSSDGDHLVTLRVTSSSGLSALAQATVSVSALPAISPSAPADLVAKPGAKRVTLEWKRPSDGPTPDYYVIRNEAGAILDAVAADASGDPTGSWTDLHAPAKVLSRYSVTAVNEAGEGSAATAAATPTSASVPVIEIADKTLEENNVKGFVGPLPGVKISDPDDPVENLSLTNNAPSPLAPGVHTVTWTVRDPEGNSATADQVVTVTKPRAITFVGMTSGAGTTASIDVPLPAGVRPGDQILVSVAASTSGSGSSTVAGYESVGVYGADSSGIKNLVFRRTARAGDAMASIRGTADVAGRVVLVAVYRGVDPTRPVDTSSYATAAGANAAVIPSITTGIPGERIVLFASARRFAGGAGAGSTSVEITERGNAASRYTYSVVGDRTQTAPGQTGSNTITGTNDSKVGVMIGLRGEQYVP